MAASIAATSPSQFHEVMRIITRHVTDAMKESKSAETEWAQHMVAGFHGCFSTEGDGMVLCREGTDLHTAMMMRQRNVATLQRLLEELVVVKRPKGWQTAVILLKGAVAGPKPSSQIREFWERKARLIETDVLEDDDLDY